MTDSNGWGGDHVGKLVALKAAAKHLAGPGKVRDRYDSATSALATYREADFPEALRPAFTRIMDARIESRRDISPTYAVFAFDELGPKRRAQIAADITTLYEACLIDI